jgi:hypothetical protein
MNDTELRCYVLDTLYGDRIDIFIQLLEMDPMRLQTELDRTFDYLSRGTLVCPTDALDRRQTSS